MVSGILVVILSTVLAVVVNDHTTWGGPEFNDLE